jgi:magnesium-protoporphyrin O-methyltransferase
VAGTCCEVTDHAFGEAAARNEARLYRGRGPAGQTRELLNAIRLLGLEKASLLDIGGGIGAIHHELLPDLVGTAVHVDASSAYLKEAKAESARRGHTDRVTFIHADYTEVAEDLPQADLVTMDRVVCCYPDFRTLLSAAARKCRRVLAMTYPRETWYVRFALHLLNAFECLRGEPFRSYLHPVPGIDTLLRGQGLHRIFLKRLFVWEVALYARP